jgi:methionyl-tRNA synthetase
MAKTTVTTSIAYINAEPHIGFLLELVAADVLARYYRLQGDDVFFLTGTDEHGVKVQRAAEALKQKPQQYADAVAAKFQKVTKDFSISNDYFVRTTDAKHVEFVQKSWKKLTEAGVISKRKYEGLYCAGCEAFKTEREIDNGKCVIHEVELEKVAEENYYLELSDQTKTAIRSWIESIEPETKRAEVLNILEDFEGVSVSRPKDKLSWGIPVPGDPDQVMYVWVDALLNYLSALVAADKSVAEYWPAIQVIGKDIVKFHAVIWPTILLALELPLPKKLLVHGFITVDGKKMSKSLGNVVSPSELETRYGVEATRYLLLRQLNFYSDSNFVWKEFDALYEGELANGLGNLVNRTINLLAKCREKGVSVTQYEPKIDSALISADFSGELQRVNELISAADQWISDVKPWEWLKSGKVSADQAENLLRQSSIIEIASRLEPFMPETAKNIRAQLKSLKPQPLFPRLSA